MSENMMYVIIGLLVIAVIFLFVKSGSSKSLTESKAADVERKRAALAARKRAEADAARDK